MPRPVEPKTIEQILAAYDENLGRNEIARRVGVSVASVTRYCRENGRLFDTSKSELAVAIQNLNLEKARRDLASGMVLRAQEALEAFDAPATVVHYQQGNETNVGQWVEHVLDQPTFADQQRIMTMAGIAFDKATRLTEKSGLGAEKAVGLLDILGDAIDQAADALRNETPLPDTPDE